MAVSSKEKRSFCFTVEGKYYGAHGATGLPVVKLYVAKFILPSQEAALSVIVRHLLIPYLTKNYADFGSLRTHHITSMVTEGRLPDSKVLQMSFDDMEIQDLSDFCILKQIFIDPYKHKNFEQCREQVMKIFQSRTDEKAMAKKSGKDVEQKEIDELLKLNNLPRVDTSIPNVNMQKQNVALKPRDGRIEETVGAPRAEAAIEQPEGLAGLPDMVEEPVDNDPKLTAAAFEENIEKSKTKPEDGDPDNLFI